MVHDKQPVRNKNPYYLIIKTFQLKNNSLILALFIMLFIQESKAQDTLFMYNGDVVVGTILSERNRHLTIQLNSSEKEFRINNRDIDSINYQDGTSWSANRELPEYLKPIINPWGKGNVGIRIFGPGVGAEGERYIRNWPISLGADMGVGSVIYPYDKNFRFTSGHVSVPANSGYKEADLFKNLGFDSYYFEASPLFRFQPKLTFYPLPRILRFRPFASAGIGVGAVTQSSYHLNLIYDANHIPSSSSSDSYKYDIEVTRSIQFSEVLFIFIWY